MPPKPDQETPDAESRALLSEQFILSIKNEPIDSEPSQKATGYSPRGSILKVSSVVFGGHELFSKV